MTDPKRASGALVLLDADVLYPIRICDFILTASTLGLLQKPIASDEILAEAYRNLRADRPDLDVSRVDRRFNLVRQAVDGHQEPIPSRLADVAVVNPKDRHVLAAARYHRVDFVITNDTRLRREVTSWIAESGSSHPREAISADDLAARLVREVPSDVRAVVAEMARRFHNPVRTYAEVLDGLCKSMPSLVTLR